jgi:uncharacterized protein (TIGR02265 family)
MREALSPSNAGFVEPSWSAPLDVDAVLRGLPPTATISGMFIAPLVAEAKRVGATLPSARERYVQFRFYPLSEHVNVLVETCQRVHPGIPLRQALRKLGRGAPAALVASTLGKVVLAAAAGPHDVIEAIAKAYPLNARPSQVTVLERAAQRAIIRLEDVYYFPDSHHVGVFEGALKYAGVRGKVLISPHGKASVDLLLEWES